MVPGVHHVVVRDGGGCVSYRTRGYLANGFLNYAGVHAVATNAGIPVRNASRTSSGEGSKSNHVHFIRTAENNVVGNSHDKAAMVYDDGCSLRRRWRVELGWFSVGFNTASLLTLTQPLPTTEARRWAASSLPLLKPSNFFSKKRRLC